MADVATATALPIRLSGKPSPVLPESCYPRELNADPEHETTGIPWVHAELAAPAPRPALLVLRVHNRAGIPIIEGRAQVAAGERHITFSELHALGIDAYTHFKEPGRIQIGQRVWSRRVYATLAAQAPQGT
ncbi:MAG: hypothetical protein RLZZ387_882 [Chloroflexota bacterium]